MSHSDAYADALGFLYGRINYERMAMPRTGPDVRLGRARRLLRELGDPHRGPTLVHVAGTKGKGSTAVLVASALSASGRTTGLFTSPHLHRLEERFQVDGQPATPEELVELVEIVIPAVQALDARAGRDPRIGPHGCTFFEITTAMSLVHFRLKNCDAVVLEVGLGGRLDSTNIVRPAVSVITSISYDHMKQLGSTLELIAGEKAGIIKRGVPAVSGVSDVGPRDVIRSVARRRNAALREIQQEFIYLYEQPRPPLDRPQAGWVHVHSWRDEWGRIELPLFGPHQASNAAVALATLDVLGDAGVVVDREAVIRGWSSAHLPARVELVERSPYLIIDGAHNPASASALADTVRLCFPPGPRTLVFGTTRDKDLPGQLARLSDTFDRVIATQYRHNPRATPVDEVAQALSAWPEGSVDRAEGPAEAIERARAITPPDGLIAVTGSLFLAAEARAEVLGIPPAPAPALRSSW
jgi:dihydrofolate synthase/folylpolyglutamate synthase